MSDFVSNPMVAEDLRAVLQRIKPYSSGIVQAVGAESFDYATAIRSANPDVVESIGQAFVESCESELAGISAAITAQDSAVLLRNAYTLRGRAISMWHR